MLTIHNGLTRRDGDSTLSPGSVSLPAGTRERLDTYLDKALPALGKPYMVILTEEDRQKADAGTLVNENLPILRDANLSLAKYAEFLQAWCDDYADCQASAAIVLSPAGLYRDFAKYQDAPLIFEADGDTFDAETGLVVFRVPAPLDSKKIKIHIPTLDAKAEERRKRALRRRLASLDGGQFLRGPIIQRLTGYYDGMGLDPEVTVFFDGLEPSITILEGSRIRSIAFPYGLPVKNRDPDWQKTDIALYSVLRDSDFREGYVTRRKMIRTSLAGDPTPVLDFQSQLHIEPRKLPYASRLRIPVQQLLLQQNGFSLGVTGAVRRLVEVPNADGGSQTLEFSFLDLRLEDISQGPPKADAPPAAAPPIDASGNAQPHSAETDPQPAFVKPTAVREITPSSCCHSLADADKVKPKTRFLGGGGQYVPGQGFRLFGVAQESDLHLPFTNASISASGGSGGGKTALATASFSADYIAFEKIHRRLALTFQGGQNSQSDRFLLGRKLDELRRGGMARLELELFRDRGGHLLKFFAEGHRESILLTKDGVDALKNSLTAGDIGATHLFQSSNSPYPWILRIEPLFRLALRTGTVDNFRRGSVAARFHRTLPGHFGIELAGRFEQASDNTPDFELPSLGGQESVRGFRKDDALGNRLWSAQCELWTPMPFLQKNDFVRENLRLAAFFDAGNAYRNGANQVPFRKGPGVGARLTYGPVILKADLAYGFGEAATHMRRIKAYFGATINLPI